MYTKRNEIRDLVELAIFRYRYKKHKNEAEEMEILNNQVSFKRSMLANKQQLQNMLGDDSEETALSRAIKEYWKFSKESGLGDVGYIGDTAYFAPAR